MHFVNSCKLLFSFFSASDLVMKVDALLSAQPKGEARIEYHFFEERYRYRIAKQYALPCLLTFPCF